MGDRKQFGDYIKCNLDLYRLRNGVQLSTTATANFTRNELADFLRSNPHNVSVLIGGYTKEEGPKLFWMDELASLGSVNNAAHGYGRFRGFVESERRLRCFPSPREHFVWFKITNHFP